MRDGPDCAEWSKLLNGIDVLRCGAAVTTVLTTESGATLMDGLPKDTPLKDSAYLPARMRPHILSQPKPGAQFLTCSTRPSRVRC